MGPEVVGGLVQFLACATVIAIAGARLCHYGEVISEHTGLTRSVVGLVMLATVTSLPELVTGIAAIVAAQAPDIAVGNFFGSNLFNLVILVVDEVAFTGGPLLGAVSPRHAATALSAAVMTTAAIWAWSEAAGARRRVSLRAIGAGLLAMVVLDGVLMAHGE